MPEKRPKKYTAEPVASTRSIDDPLSIDNVAQLKALAHPLRMKLLDKFASKPMTTMQISTELGMQPNRLYHHVAKLEDAGLITLVKTRRVRGTTEKYYSSVANSLRIDRSAFKSESSKLVGEIVELGILDSLFNNIRCEVKDYLSQRDPDSNDIQHEILFAATEVSLDEDSVPAFRERLTRLIEEFHNHEGPNGSDAGKTQNFRLLVGWYPNNSD